jgi:hypothetical protein
MEGVPSITLTADQTYRNGDKGLICDNIRIPTCVSFLFSANLPNFKINVM